MSHSYYNLWVHLIFSTKDRRPLITDNVKESIYKCIKDELSSTGIFARIINGMQDHVHCLFMQNPTKSIAETIKNLKGVTSHWINQNNIVPMKFSWQTGYAAFSVSESQLEKVYRYILYQEKHHLKRTFEQEYDEILKNNNLSAKL